MKRASLQRKRNTYCSRWWKTLCTWPPPCCAPSLPPWLVPRAVTVFRVCGVCFVPDHSGSSLLLLGAFSRCSQQVCNRAGSGIFVLVGWDSGRHHPACPPAHSSHPGLPRGTLDYHSAAACSEGSSGALCPSLYTVIVPVMPPCDQGRDSLGLLYKDLNNACFKGCIDGMMYSGHLGARKDDWSLAAFLGAPCGFRHSQDFPAQLATIATLLFRSISKPQNHPSVVCWESYALRMHYHPSPWPCTVRQIRIITVYNENILEQALSLMTFLHENKMKDL